LRSAYEAARDDLLAERCAEGHWIGELSTSALSTATAVSALSLFRRHREDEQRFSNSDVDHLIQRGVTYLTSHQNEDGGWGDTDLSYSNVATTMLGVAAMHLAGEAEKHAKLLEKANSYIDNKGRLEALRERYGVDKTFVVPILTNCALAGLVPWKQVAALPFQLACLPQSFYRFVRMPVVSYAIPALVAIGQAKYFHDKPKNPLSRLIKAASVRRSLKVLERMQPSSGGYLEAIPLTSFVTMSLAATGRCHERVAQQGIQFIFDSVRDDGSWPIDTNLATWNTSLAIGALAAGGEDVNELRCWDWLLSCQHVQRHPFTGADPGGWGWSDLSGAVPDADDTPAALLALHDAVQASPGQEPTSQQVKAAELGIRWLLDLQNRDGGWPTFCRGWGKLPFDRSGSDLTAHAIRALDAWKHRLADRRLRRRIDKATTRGFLFLEKRQRGDGSWLPLWFGNQDHPEEENPIYGTVKVLLAYAQLQQLETPHAERGLTYLTDAANADGGWGGGPDGSSVEETALAVEALCLAGMLKSSGQMEQARNNGLDWLCQQVESGRNGENAPIGFYFAKLWYYERLYPRTFTASALGHACRLHHTHTADTPEADPA